MGDEAKYMVGAVASAVVFGWGIIRWVISRHDALREKLSKQIEDANTAMNNRILEVQRSVQVAAESQRDRLDTCSKEVRVEISGKADRAQFERVTERLFERLDELRHDMIGIVGDLRKGP